MLTFRTHDIMIFGGMNGKLLQKIYFLKKRKENMYVNRKQPRFKSRLKNQPSIIATQSNFRGRDVFCFSKF